MKKHVILIIAFLLPVLNFIYTQSPCLPEGITFTSQAQIDSFPINYPGCTEIEGDLKIDEHIHGNITNLDSLYSITSIAGNMSVGGNKALMSLSGLESLTSV